MITALAGPAAAQSSLAGDTIRISRAVGPIKIDGDLSDDGWRSATRVEKWYEVQPGDNNEPPVRSVGFITFDDRFLYIGFEFDDPNPHAIRAPLGDHDNVNGASTDFAGIFLDPLNSGRTAVEFFVTPRNVQYDAITDDASGENASPDFFWDSAAAINEHGWTLEMRIPFSSLRYKNRDPQTWGIILFRNYPRQSRYQFFSARLPRNSNCLVCRENPLIGLDHLPAGGHIVVAPYVASTVAARVPDDEGGDPLLGQPLVGNSTSHIGLDL
ncbi:MAG TPA: carbohydrate binding family 9 domain-containing protein, partial [Vicinamibacterales bacterium]|nr:carbohydrate binding family 9 domain-containing protein [Vicinamibacterales bacterium]